MNIFWLLTQSFLRSSCFAVLRRTLKTWMRCWLRHFAWSENWYDFSIACYFKTNLIWLQIRRIPWSFEEIFIFSVYRNPLQNAPVISAEVFIESLKGDVDNKNNKVWDSMGGISYDVLICIYWLRSVRCNIVRKVGDKNKFPDNEWVFLFL